MGSGMFPVERSGRLGNELANAAKRVESVCEEIEDEVYSGESGGMQFDNAASDGSSLGLLRLAAKLIRDEVQRDETS